MHSSTNVTYNLSAASYRGLVMPCVIKKSTFYKTPLRQNQNESSGKNKSQTSEQTSVFQNVNQAAAKQTYFTLWLAAKPKQAMCLLACLSSGQVNKAVSSVLFYFRWVYNTPARQNYNYQPSKHNLYISHLSFKQITQAVIYHQCLDRWLLYWNKSSENIYVY